MKKILSLFALVLLSCTGAWAADNLVVSTTEASPEHQYRLRPRNEQNYWLTAGLHAGNDVSAAGRFAFFEAEGEGNYYVYSVTESKWLTYTDASNGPSKVTLGDTKSSYFNIEYGTSTGNAWGDKTGYVLKASSAGVYMNFFQGVGSNNYTSTGTVGFWQDKFSDAGSVWVFEEIDTSITGYKNAAKAGLDAYYLASESLKTNAIAQIDAATDEAGVDAAVSAAFTAYQSEVAGKYWFIQSGYSEYYKQQSVYKCFIYNGSNKTTWGNQEDNNPNCYYKLEIAAGGKICIKSNDGKYMQGVAGAMNTTKVEASLTSYPDGTFNIVFSNGTCHTEGHNNGAGVSGNLVSWGGGAGSASSWKFIEKTQADYEAAVNAVVRVTYNYYIDGVKFNTTVATVRVGQAYPAAIDYAGYTITGLPTGNVTGDGSYDLYLGDFDGPFVPTTLSGDAFADGTKWYYMYHPHTSAYVYYLNDSEKKSGFNAAETNDPAYKWTFVRKQGTPYFYLYNKKAGAVDMREQLSTNTGWAANHNQGFVVANVEAAEMPLELFTNGTGYGFRLAAVDGVCILGKHTDDKLSIWGNSANKGDNGSRFTFAEAPVDGLGVAYTVKVLGADLGVSVKGTAYTNGATTAEISDLAETDIVLADNDDYVGTVAINGSNIIATYHHKGAAIDFTKKKVSVGEKATAIVPDTKWYVLTQLRGGETPTYITADNKVYRAAAANTVETLFPGKAEELATYLVRFVSTNVEGVYEIQHGNGMYWNTEGANNRKLTASDNVAESKFYFVYGATQEDGNTPGWAMNYTTDFTTKADKVDNDAAGNTVGYWASGNITSGTNNVWFLYETTFEDLPAYDWEAYGDLLADLNDMYGTELGKYSVPGMEEADVWEALTGYNVVLSAELESEYDGSMLGMQALKDAMQINLPQKGQLIRIKTSSDWINEPTYLAGATASNGRLSFVQNPDFSAEAEDNTIWIYDGQYLINYANGLTVATTAAQNGHGTLAMYPNTTKIEFLPAANGAIGKYNIRFASTRNLYTNKALYTDAGSGAATAEGYNFELEDATTYFFLDFGDKGWASGYFPIAVAASPEYGIDAAYYIKNDPENNCFQAEPVGEQGRGLIMPFTPVIIKVNSEINSGTPFVKGAPDYTLEPEESALKGALWTQKTPDNCCVFNVVDDQPGFYGYTGATLKHCKAYYEPATPAASALRINFGEDNTLTGIMEAIEKAEFNGNVYDLQGRRINGVQKGVFVKDGKKIVK